MIRAVLFDVDGTLYHQTPLRALMAAELATVPWVGRAPWQVPRLWRMLSAFRHVREELRALGRPEESLARLQYTSAAERAHVPVLELEAAVEEWIYQRPLKYLRRVVRSDMAPVLETLTSRGLRIGAFSDYPVGDKLDAMGLRGAVTLELDATAESINAFKPHPRGLEVACERWGLAPEHVLYVGDRPEVDAYGAAQARMPCAIVGTASGRGTGSPYAPVPRMRDLLVYLDREMGTC